MKTTLSLLIILVLGFSVAAQDPDTEKEAIKKLVLTAYVDGLQNKGDLDATRKGFFPGFNLLMLQDGMINKLPIYNWIAYAEMKRSGEQEALTEEELTSCTFEFIDVTGSAAVAKIHLSKGGKRIFTDYLSFYKLDDGWKIVGKIYYRIPE
jgi:hypothetical protein